VQHSCVRGELHAAPIRPRAPAIRERGAQQRHEIARDLASVTDMPEHVSGDIVEHLVKVGSIGQIERKHELVVGHGGRFYSES